MRLSDWTWLRPPALALAAAIHFGEPALGQSLSFEERIAQCKACHGQDGNSRMEKIPSIAGQPEFFILNQLVLMREGVRRVAAMAEAVKGLTDAEIEALAKYFANRPARASDEPIDPELVKRGAELATKLRCGSCHAANMTGHQQIPRLAGQRVDYLIASLKDYRDNTRSGADTLMSVVVQGLSDADLAALAHYAASR
ncbi:MAG TPA: c-type cytochrome [Xanthobacteraceae bacterium]|nr:c-type cytochrome [Xanthobacteraceae bacterium]